MSKDFCENQIESSEENLHDTMVNQYVKVLFLPQVIVPKGFRSTYTDYTKRMRRCYPPLGVEPFGDDIAFAFAWCEPTITVSTMTTMPLDCTVLMTYLDVVYEEFLESIRAHML